MKAMRARMGTLDTRLYDEKMIFCDENDMALTSVLL